MAIAPTTPVAFPPGPKGMPLLGNVPAIQSKGMIEFTYETWRKYGDLASTELGPLRAFQIVRPEHIQHVMVKHPEIYVKGMSHDKLRSAIGNGILTLEGDLWARQRRLMGPTYTPKGVRNFADQMVSAADQMVERWNTQSATGEPVDIGSEMTRVTMQVISEAMFGMDISQQYREAARALIGLLEYTAHSSGAALDVPLFVPTPKNQRLKANKAELRSFLMGIIEGKRRDGLSDDLLSLLMSSRDEDTGEYMTDEQLHDEVLITIFAGHETTANLLTWTWYLLSHYPAVEARLHDELEQVLGGREPTLDDVPNLTYTRQVLDEVLRLYAPTPLLARDAAADDELGGYVIPKGSMITIFIYGTHRHPEFWEKPHAFYPDHFLPENTAKRPRYAYLPFGAGRRICIGQHFAQLEATLILASVAQRYNPRLAQPNDGEMRFVGVARPKHPIIMTLDRR